MTYLRRKNTSHQILCQVLYVLTLVTTLIMPTHLLTGIFGMNWQDAAPRLISTPSPSCSPVPSGSVGSAGPVGPVGPIGPVGGAEDGKPVVPGLGVMEESRGYYLFWGCPAAALARSRIPGSSLQVWPNSERPGLAFSLTTLIWLTFSRILKWI